MICDLFSQAESEKLVKAERSATGHQLLDMTEDWYRDSVDTQQEVPSLAAYAEADC